MHFSTKYNHVLQKIVLFHKFWTHLNKKVWHSDITKGTHQNNISGYGLSRWETTLKCNVVSHWLRIWAQPMRDGRRYHVTSSLNGWAHTQNDPWERNQYVHTPQVTASQRIKTKAELPVWDDVDVRPVSSIYFSLDVTDPSQHDLVNQIMTCI